MRVTAVPAQVTTVEDRIMGSLSFSQVLLLVTPIFSGGALFGILPPAMSSSAYKFVLIGCMVLTGCILAIRIKGKIVARWLSTILRYNLRPKYYLFNKNASFLREMYELKQVEGVSETEVVQRKKIIAVPVLGILETTQVLAAIDNPATKLIFEANKKGGLHVRLTKVEE